MARLRFLTSAVLVSMVFFATLVPSAYGHGGHGGHGGFGHGGFGHAGYHGFGYGGYHGFHGFGYGYGYRGFGFGGFGYPFFGGFGYPFFGGFGYPFFGGFGYPGFGLGGLGYGLYGLGGLGFRGFGYGGYGYGGYGGFSGACNCCCLSIYPAYGSGIYSPYGGDPLPMPRTVSSLSRYRDYYARNAHPAAPSTIVSNPSATRYVDYYARNAGRTAENKALLHVSLPADAELWLNGKRMSRTGPERDFITPQLQEGETYAYQVKARWTQDGRSQEETIEVKVRANKTTNVRLGEASLAKR
jgi:uncharacterized protein (TIGR03000 family)